MHLLCRKYTLQYCAYFFVARGHTRDVSLVETQSMHEMGMHGGGDGFSDSPRAPPLGKRMLFFLRGIVVATRV